MTLTKAERVFVRVSEPERLLRALTGGTGGFIPTRMASRTGRHAVLAIQLPRVPTTIDVPIRVMGRRERRDRAGRPVVGIIARIEDHQHPMVRLLWDVSHCKVVDIEARVAAMGQAG